MISPERYKKILGSHFEKVSKCFVGIQKSIRTNTLKISSETLVKKLQSKGWNLEKFPFYGDGFFVKTGEFPSKSIEHNLGYFFIQNSSSTVPPVVLDPEQDEIILDLAASPGAKTTQMAMMMKNEGAI